jgi:hypothetical protein
MEWQEMPKQFVVKILFPALLHHYDNNASYLLVYICWYFKKFYASVVILIYDNVYEIWVELLKEFNQKRLLCAKFSADAICRRPVELSTLAQIQ